jgi:hypothetical protein
MELGFVWCLAVHSAIRLLTINILNGLSKPWQEDIVSTPVVSTTVIDSKTEVSLQYWETIDKSHGEWHAPFFVSDPKVETACEGNHGKRKAWLIVEWLRVLTSTSSTLPRAAGRPEFVSRVRRGDQSFRTTVA